MLNTAEFKERVERGAQWMDAEHPGWEHRITSELHMASVSQCIIGQGVCRDSERNYDYDYVVRSHVDAHERWESEHGFNVRNPNFRTQTFDERCEYNDEAFALLEKLWQIQIQDRLIGVE